MAPTVDSFIKVVIIDDEKKIIALLKKIINWDEFNCAVLGEAYNGLEGLALIKEKVPHIVFSDVKMPGKNGIDMMRSVKEGGIEPVFIFISGYSEFEYAQNALNQGAIGYILKPIDKDKVEQLLRKAINLIRLTEENRAIKEIANENMENYFDMIGFYDNKNIYTFYSSDNEARLVSSIKRNSRTEIDIILNQIFKEADKKYLNYIQIKKLAQEIRSSILKNFTKFDILKSLVDVYVNFLKNCNEAEDIKKSVFEFIYKVAETINEYKNSTLENIIEKAKNYIKENISNDISLASVAEHFYMNSTYFSELFKRETDQTFVEFVTKYKLDAAKELLRKSTLKIEDISRRVGYENEKYFYKVFKKNEGVTPREYRELKIW